MARYGKVLYLSMLVAILILSGCQMAGTYKDVSVDDAKEMIDNDEVIVLDVRTDEEYAAGHIPDSILIPVEELAGRVDELDRNQAYLVVCRSGNRSVTASEILIDNSFDNVYNMDIGMNGWVYEIEVK